MSPPESFHTRPAAYVVCHDESGRVLLTQFEKDRHPDNGAWTLPGGGMEWGESPAETAQREFTEDEVAELRRVPVVGLAIAASLSR